MDITSTSWASVNINSFSLGEQNSFVYINGHQKNVVGTNVKTFHHASNIPLCRPVDTKMLWSSVPIMHQCSFTIILLFPQHSIKYISGHQNNTAVVSICQTEPHRHLIVPTRPVPTTFCYAHNNFAY